ncbi:MAG TPA: helix-turn-helix domain-containing protein [Acidimicrobiales bacterium]|nr:helix-turn-helix domain-containing protein [Acidimicrobiales bacterium]
MREDILRAAEELLATRAPSEISLREIARHGGFQHSLITRHFGTKDDLMAEVLQRTLRAYADAVRDADDPIDGFMRGLDHVATHPASFQAMARALMDRRGTASDDGPFTAFEIHRERLERNRPGAADGFDLDVLTVALMALTTGWAFNEDRWLRRAGFRDGDRDRVRERLAELIGLLVEHHAPTESQAEIKRSS